MKMKNPTFARITGGLLVVSAFLLVQLVLADDSVIDYSNLSPDAFKSEVESQDLVLVKFYAPWCGHCKRLAPEYEQAAKKLAGDDPAVPLAKVDCTNESGGKDICSQNDVQGYPTVKIFRNGQASDYNDGRDAESIVKKMRSLAGPASKEFDSFEKLDTHYKTAKNLLVVGLFQSAEDSLFKQFIETANQNRDLASYVHVFENKASDKFEQLVTLNADKSVKLPSVVLARQAHYRSKFEPDFLVYDASDDLKDWVQENAHGLVMARSQTNRDVPKPNVVVYYNVDYERDPKGTNYWRNRVLKVASQYKDQDVTFAISNINTFAAELNDFGLDMARLSKDPSPAVVAKDKDGKKYAMSEKFSLDSFGKFVQSFLDGKLEPFMKSEDEPDNEDAAVKVAVGKNFDKLVTKSEKDVFIEFYAPWCGHCKSLAPTWEELGNKLRDEPGVDIVKLDATANDVPDLFTVHGFPTLYWFPKDTKTPVKYEGGRDISDLLGYVAKHATDELEGYTRTGDEKKREEFISSIHEESQNKSFEKMTWFKTLLGDPESNSIKTPKGVTQDYNALRQQSLASGRLFEDNIFAPRSSRNCEWLRPFEISSSPKFISSGVSRFDVVQGELGDCWLIAAVANLTLDQKLFALVVPPDQSFERGSYCGIFRFRFWQFGKWVEVVIDDRLPTRDGHLLFMRSSDPDEFWSPLFEKAYAKLHGSYDALRGGTTCEAMVDLTGGLTEFFDIQTSEAPPNLYAIIKKAFERGSLIGCSIEAQDESQRENELPNGLIKGHAYSVTSVLEISVRDRQLPMLRLRNPWSGTTEWKGPWSDSSREWSMISDYEKRKIGLVFEADGEFWISFHDFRENFTRVELCNLTPDSLEGNVQRQWHSQVFEGSWVRGCTAGGCRNNLNTFAQNPQYVVTLVDPDEDDDEENCTMIVALMQKNKRSAKRYQMGSSDLTIGFAIYALRDTGYFDQNPTAYSPSQNGQQILSTDFFKYNTSVARSPTYINLREVTARFSLPPGTYAIIPSTFDKGEEGDFILRVWTETPVHGGPPAPSPNNYPAIPAPQPAPARPSPRPSPKLPEPAPAYPRYPTPTPPQPSDPDKKPAYPAYPSPALPSGPGYPPYPTNPAGGGGFPSYPAYPSLPPSSGGDIRYPTMPDEPSIQRRKVKPPPPGPSIDISIGEVIGTVSTIISILTMCYNTYKSMSQHSAQTYPFGGNQFAAPSSYGGSSQQYPSSSYGGGRPESFVQSHGYSMEASNPNAATAHRERIKDEHGTRAHSSRL